MKEIILQKVSLQNWRAQNRDVSIFGDMTTISGKNKSGKSSVFNAFLWTLTGYDSNGRSNFELFDNTIEQTPENSKKAVAEVVLSVEGEIITLRRETEIGWVRKRGTQNYERSGSDSYHYFIDNIEHSAKLYKERVESIFNAPMDKILIMLNITHFLSLDWKVMRKHLNDIIGELSDADFKGDYSAIIDMLNKYSTEDLKEMYKAQMRPIKENVNSLPAVIQTLYDSVGEEINRKEIEQEIELATAELTSLDEKIADSNKALQPYYDKRNAEEREISTLRAELDKQRREYEFNESDELVAARKELQSLRKKNAEITSNNEIVEGKKRTLTREIARLESEIKYRENQHKVLTERNNECKARTFTEDTCRYCGQPLPEDKMEVAKAKFEAERKREHERIVEDGKINKSLLESARENLNKAQFELSTLSTETLLDTKDIEAKIADLSALKAPFEETIAFQRLSEKIADIRANLTEIPTSVTEELKQKRGEILEVINNLNKQLGKADAQDEAYRKAIAKQSQLEAETAELAKLEGKLNCVVEYERERASIISTRANRYFSFIKVEMTEVNKSGDIVDTCKVLDANGVSVAVTNTASRIVSGLDMAVAFAKFYDVAVPVFVDNAEAINESNFPFVPAQVIKIKATEDFFTIESK